MTLIPVVNLLFLGTGRMVNSNITEITDTSMTNFSFENSSNDIQRWENMDIPYSRQIVHWKRKRNWIEIESTKFSPLSGVLRTGPATPLTPRPLMARWCLCSRCWGWSCRCWPWSPWSPTPSSSSSWAGPAWGPPPTVSSSPWRSVISAPSSSPPPGQLSQCYKYPVYLF